MSPKTYKKLVASKLSKNFRDAAQIVETDFPIPNEDEIVMRNLYAGVNASDINFSGGLYKPDVQPPFDLGFEALGEVVEVGSGVQHLKKGDFVIAMSLGGGFREYSLHKARYAIPVPAPQPEYVSIILSGLTAAFGLYMAGEMTSGETVLVTAAAGGTGQYAVQLAKLAGNHVIGTCSTDEKAALLKKLGCDRVINYRQEDFPQVLRREYPTGIDLIYESVGGAVFDACVKNLAVRGRLVIIGYISEYQQDKPEKVTMPRIYNYLLWKSASVRGMFLNHYLKYAPDYLPRLMELYQDGKLAVMVDPKEFRGIESVVDAVEYLHSGNSVGKVIVRF